MIPLFLFRLAFGFVVVFIFIPLAHAQRIPYDIAQRIIVSEGADQGLKGMICVAEVLRLRASVKGFDGYKSSWINSEPKSVWDMAAKAWRLSAYTHYTKGADHFENVHRFGKPWWAKYCVITFEYKDHVFYKEIRQQSSLKQQNGD